MDTLLNFARACRLALFQLTSTRVFGVEFDVILHLLLAALIFWLAERRLGARRAAWLLAVLIILKEVADVFLKSQLRYIHRPTPEMLLDIGTDLFMGAAGGLLTWLVLKAQRARAASEAH